MTTKKKRYWWFQGASVSELILRLSGIDPRLEVHLDGDKMTLEVVSGGVTEFRISPPINESHVCPPICP